MEFSDAIAAALADTGGKGIGTLGEKTLHLALKYYFSPDPETHECKVGGYVADIVNEDGVTEIQTRSLARLKPKLEAFLECCPVTVVYPVVRNKLLIRMDENGELLSQRRSPKHETVWDAMQEIYALRQFLTDARFRVVLCMLDLEEYSVQTGARKRVKRDRVPVCMHEILRLESPADYINLLPELLPQPVTVPQLAELLGTARENVRCYLNILAQSGLAEVCGRSGRYKLWRIVSEDSGG